MKNFVRDEIGYINNRGRSKYWGVTVRQDDTCHDRWMVSYKPSNGEETHSMGAVGFRLKEEDAAKFAAAVYETGQLRQNTVKLKVLSVDKKFVLYTRNNALYREAYTTQAVYQPAPTVTLDEAQPELSKEQVVRKVRRIRKIKGDQVAKLTKLILDGNLNAKSTRALIAVLESTLPNKG